jgi:hypothetical protein
MNTQQIIGLIGFIGCGKGTVAQILVQNYNFRQDSFASSLKDVAASIFDWPRYLLEGDTKESREWRELVDPWWEKELSIPNFSPRLALQLMGTDVLRNHFHNDIWFLTLQNRYRKVPDKSVVVSDVRFLNELGFIKKNNGILIRVNRGVLPEWYSCAADANAGNLDALEIMKSKYSHIHSSEWSLCGTVADFEINNNGTISDLYNEIEKCMKCIK